MTTEFLKSLGLEKDVIDKVFAEHGKSIESLKSDNDALKAQLETAQETIKSANAEIKGYKDLDIDGIQKKASEWEQKAIAAEEKATKEIEALRFDTALSSALTSARARNPKAVRALLNVDALKQTESGIVGLNEQLEAIKKDNGYLFEPEPAGGAGFGDKTPPNTATNTNEFMNNLIRGSRGE